MGEAKSSKKKSIQKTVHWEPDVLEALEQHMRREKINNFSVAANDAVRYGVCPEYRDDRNAELFRLYSQISFSVAEHRKKTARDLMILQELSLQLIKLLFAQLPALPEKDRLTAEKQANARLDKLMEEVIRSLPAQRNEE